MKRTIIILLPIFILTGSIFFLTDYRLYFYGKSIFDFYHPLPFGIEPVYNINGFREFKLISKHKLVLVGARTSVGQFGSKYQDDEISKVLKYGYNDSEIVALIKDRSGRKLWTVVKGTHFNATSDYIFSFDTKIPESKLNFHIKRWYSVGNIATSGFINTLKNISAMCFLGSTILFLGLIFMLARIFMLKQNKCKYRNDTLLNEIVPRANK